MQSVVPHGSAVVLPDTQTVVDEISRDLAPELRDRLAQAARRQLYGFRIGPYGREMVQFVGQSQVRSNCTRTHTRTHTDRTHVRYTASRTVP